MKPFSTPVLSKRTYRELKLLKHIQHENVCHLYLLPPSANPLLFLDHQPQRRFHFTLGGHVGHSMLSIFPPALTLSSSPSLSAIS